MKLGTFTLVLTFFLLLATLPSAYNLAQEHNRHKKEIRRIMETTAQLEEEHQKRIEPLLLKIHSSQLHWCNIMDIYNVDCEAIVSPYGKM